MRTHQYLLQGVAALCVAQASMAQERIGVLMPAVLDPSAPIAESVKRECNVEGMIGDEVFQRVSQRYPGTAQVRNAEQAGDGYVVVVTITNVVGTGGGAWSGKKSVSIRADVLRNSKLVATRNLFRQSGGGIYGGTIGTCKIMELIAVALGKDVAAWMPSALVVMNYAPAPAAQPASPSDPQPAPGTATDGATPSAAAGVENLKDLEGLLPPAGSGRKP
jgi:hypothetical protein